MHRHGYKGRKLGRKRDERRRLLKQLAVSLILEKSIVTTLPKAKEALPFVEKLITKAKVGTLASRRLIHARLSDNDAAFELVDQIVPKLTERNSGHIRLTKVPARRGDGAPMARLEFVDDLDAKTDAKPKKAATKPATKRKTKETAKA
jgi:large subunit ribosomal protein L17